MARKPTAKRVARGAQNEEGRPLRAPAAARNARAARQAERRDAILAAALEEFSARGFAATRLDDVARRAGVAKGTIYLYFGDKESAVPGAGARDARAPWSARIETAQLRYSGARDR